MISEEKRDRILALLKSGATFDVIRRLTKSAPETIAYVRNEAGIAPSPSGPRPGTGVTRAQQQGIVDRLRKTLANAEEILSTL